MSQFNETQSVQVPCANPGCSNVVVSRSVRDTRGGGPSYCSRVCASQSRYSTRYRGSLSGPADRPRPMEKTKFR